MYRQHLRNPPGRGRFACGSEGGRGRVPGPRAEGLRGALFAVAPPQLAALGTSRISLGTSEQKPEAADIPSAESPTLTQPQMPTVLQVEMQL